MVNERAEQNEAYRNAEDLFEQGEATIDRRESLMKALLADGDIFLVSSARTGTSRTLMRPPRRRKTNY